MDKLLFPYAEYRTGQKEFILEIDKAINEKKHVIVHAPTGMGKTISTLAPTLAYAIKKELTIFFLTNRHSQHKIVLETLRKIKDKYKIDFMVADIIGKKHMCSFEDVDKLSSREFYDYCKELREKDLCPFYTASKSKEAKVEREVLYDKIRKNGPLTIDQVYKLASKKFCTFEITADIAKKSNIIIADYFHILSQGIRDSFLLRINKEMGKSIIIFDEAHNLSRRSRELMSDNLSTYVIENAVKEAREFNNPHIVEALNELKSILDELKESKLEKTDESLITKNEFFQRVSDYIDYFQFIGDLEYLADLVREKKKRSFSSLVAIFLKSWTTDSQGFTRIIKSSKLKTGKDNVNISIRCLDPSILFKPIIQNSSSIICMSGTLVPTEMYKDLLGFDEAVLKEYQNPFPSENRLNVIVNGVTTKFDKRSNEMYEKISNKCSLVLNNVPGNVIIFFPSYDIMYNISVHIRKNTDRKLFFENSAHNKEERVELIDNFKRSKNGILLAVAAGSYGEGIDLPGIVKGVIIVGLPLNRPDLETKELIEYYDKRYAKGWDYAYVYPAIIKTLQNAGRCIRSEKDKGIIVFLEERYKWSMYKKCMPDDLNLIITDDPEKEVKNFFNK